MLTPHLTSRLRHESPLLARRHGCRAGSRRSCRARTVTLLDVSAMLLTLGACDVHSCEALELDERAHWVVDACGLGPREAPSGRDCAAAVVAIWATETAATLTPYPPARGTGCGPGQVIPRRRWGNSRLGYGPTPTCDRLRVPRVGLRWLVKVLRAKSIRWRWSRPRSVFRAYNASSNAERYARAAHQRLRHLLKLPALGR